MQMTELSLEERRRAWGGGGGRRWRQADNLQSLQTLSTLLLVVQTKCDRLLRLCKEECNSSLKSQDVGGDEAHQTRLLSCHPTLLPVLQSGLSLAPLSLLCSSYGRHGPRLTRTVPHCVSLYTVYDDDDDSAKKTL